MKKGRSHIHVQKSGIQVGCVHSEGIALASAIAQNLNTEKVNQSWWKVSVNDKSQSLSRQQEEAALLVPVDTCRSFINTCTCTQCQHSQSYQRKASLSPTCGGAFPIPHKSAALSWPCPCHSVPHALYTFSLGFSAPHS